MYWNPEFRNYREMEERLPLWKALDPANPKTEEEDQYGTKLEEAPQCTPSGWAAVLWLFELR